MTAYASCVKGRTRSTGCAPPVLPCVPAPRHYRSLGCIKLSPAHIKNLFAKAEQYGWPTQLKVTS